MTGRLTKSRTDATEMVSCPFVQRAKSPGRLRRRGQDQAAALAKADAIIPRACVAMQRPAVPVFEERPRLAIFESKGTGAAPGKLQQGAATIGGRAGDGSRANQVPDVHPAALVPVRPVIGESTLV